MNITELKQNVHMGLGGHTFIDRATNTNVTDQTLVNAVNIGQKRVARRLTSGGLYFEEILFLPVGSKSLTYLTSIRNLIFVSINNYSNVTYVSQVTDLPNGIYVDGTTVYQISYTDKEELKPREYMEFERLPGTYSYETTKPRYYKLFEPSKLVFDSIAETNYFIWMSGIKWPDEFTTSSTTEEPEIKNVDDLIILQAQIYLYTSVLKDREKANSLFAIFENEIDEHSTNVIRKSNKEYYIHSRYEDEDSMFPRPPRSPQTEDDLGI